MMTVHCVDEVHGDVSRGDLRRIRNELTHFTEAVDTDQNVRAALSSGERPKMKSIEIDSHASEAIGSARRGDCNEVNGFTRWQIQSHTHLRTHLYK